MAATERKWKPGTNYCSVVRCHNSGRLARKLANKPLSGLTGQEQLPPVRFYRFPGKSYEKQRREAWIQAVRRQNENGSAWVPSKTARICNYHFVGHAKSDIEQSPSYVPTTFPDVYRKKAAANEGRFNRPTVTTADGAGNSPTAQGCPEEGYVDATHEPEITAEHSAICDDESSTFDSQEGLVQGQNDRQLTAAAETQTDFPHEDGGIRIFSSVTNEGVASTQVTHDSKVTTASQISRDWKRKCGFSGFKSLEASEQSLRDLCCVTLQIFCALLNMIPDQRCKSTDMTKEDKQALFLMKLKLGISLTSLGALFGVRKSTASRAFRYVLDILSVKLERWVFVPPRDVIRDTMPDVFKQHYPSCTFIIDCTEIKTEAPGQTDQQYYLYSNYKGTFTLKVLVAIVPNGQVAFLSKTYRGRHSDTFITRDCGFLEHIQPGDVVLSDKGFPSVKADVSENGAVLIMPPMESGGQFSRQHMEDTYRVAQVRIHGERAIHRLKLFNILNNRVPVTLIPHMNKIMRVCAALVNTQSQIIKTG
ncbi:uncharacterized protein LOC135390473 [Ornithodoros turicata]|uniref:uncharacterized protein LOC135390473 n=1 Tax=Ornithodoros turicata TaxID=34597 RepID=UPI0031390605